MKQPKQKLYKPKKEKVTIITEVPKEITWRDISTYFGNKIYDHRVYILLLILILENVWWLVR